MINAIVYTSNTGYTAQYARLLDEKTGMPVYSLDEAEKSLLRAVRSSISAGSWQRRQGL